MKKRLLLIALPALMVLAGCSNHPVKPVEEKEDLSGMMLEDTTIHEDLFGSIDLNVRKLGEPVETPDAGSGFINVPKIGVQFSGEYMGDEREGGVLTGNQIPCYAVRFVAAANVDQDALDDESITATWTRGVSSNAGSAVKPIATGDSYRSTVAYESLKNGDTLTNASSEGNDYTHYLVYTMYDIPVANANSYIVAYLTLSNGVNTIKSKAVAARIGGDNAFSFDPTMTAHFLQGKINNTPNSLVKATENPGGTNHAAYYGIQLLNTDSFGSFYYSPTEFLFFGYSPFFTAESKYNESALLNSYVTPKASGTYNLYVSNNGGDDNKIFTAEGHIWTIGFGGDQVRLDACEDGGKTKYYIENITVTAGDTLHIYRDGVEDSSVYSVKENVSNNNIYTGKTIKNGGSSSIYLNTDGGIWVNVPVAAFRTINIDIGADWESQAGSYFHAWAWKNDSDGGVWYTATIVGRTGTVQIPGHCDKIELIRYKSATASWDDIWDRTGTLTIDYEKTLTVTGWSYSAEFK